MSFIQLQLSCKDSNEAEKNTKALLDKKLVACVKTVTVKSQYIWKGKTEKADEILLIMESREDLFDQIESEISKLHSYDTFVLTATAITKMNKKAEKWLIESLIKG